MKKNAASQLVSAQMLSATDGSNVTAGTCNVAVEIDGAAGTGGTATHIANGKWEYAPIQADTNGDYLTFQFVISGALTQTVQIYTTFPQTADAPTAAANADAVWDELMAGHVVDGSYGLSNQVLDTGTATGGGASTITLDAGKVFTANNQPNDSYISLVSGTGAGQSRQVTDYDFATNVATVSPAWTTQPVSGTKYKIDGDRRALIQGFVTDALSSDALATTAVNEIRDAILSDSTAFAGADVALIKADTDELQTDDIPGLIAALDAVVDTVKAETVLILEDTGTTIPGTIATAQADLDIITGASGVNLLTATQASIDAIEADTSELQVDDVPGLIAALNNLSVADVLTTQMTESYNADGAAPTVAQALHLIIAYLTERSVITTTVTAKKLDGSTAAATFTLDDATNPTSITRAT